MKAFAFMGMAVTGSVMWLGGCAMHHARAESTTGTASAPVQQHGMGMMGEMCPMQVPGTSVTSTDVEGGVAIVFTTNTGEVPELRQRVRRMAEMHNQHHATGETTSAEHAHGAGGGSAHGGSGCCMMMGGGGMMSGEMMMPAATATVEDVEHGARIVLQPKDPGQLDALREHARMAANRMAHGECPMMSSGMESHSTK